MMQLDYILARLGIGESEEGQTMAEYAVVLAVITVAVIIALGTLSGAIGAALDRITGELS